MKNQYFFMTNKVDLSHSLTNYSTPSSVTVEQMPTFLSKSAMHHNQSELVSISYPRPTSCWNTFWDKVWNFLKYLFTCGLCRQKKEKMPESENSLEQTTLQPPPEIHFSEELALQSPPPPLESFSPFLWEEMNAPPPVSESSPPFWWTQEEPPTVLNGTIELPQFSGKNYTVRFKYLSFVEYENRQLFIYSAYAQMYDLLSPRRTCYVLVDNNERTLEWRLRLIDFLKTPLKPYYPDCIKQGFSVFCQKLSKDMRLKCKTQEEIYPKLEATSLIGELYDVIGQDQQNYLPKQQIRSDTLKKILGKLHFWHFLHVRHRLVITDNEFFESISKLVAVKENPPSEGPRCPRYAFTLTWDIFIACADKPDKFLCQITCGFTKNEAVVAPSLFSENLNQEEHLMLTKIHGKMQEELRIFFRDIDRNFFFYIFENHNPPLSLKEITDSLLAEMIEW